MMAIPLEASRGAGVAETARCADCLGKGRGDRLSEQKAEERDYDDMFHCHLRLPWACQGGFYGDECYAERNTMSTKMLRIA
jgi:hypothetical protein